MTTPFLEHLTERVHAVFEQLGHWGKEVHYQRALAIDLTAIGYVPDCEKSVSTRFVDAQGNTHTISHDRIDIYVHGPGAWKAVIELKQSDTMKDEFVRQTLRYVRGMRAAGEPVAEAYVVCFPKTDGKTPLCTPVSDSFEPYLV